MTNQIPLHTLSSNLPTLACETSNVDGKPMLACRTSPLISVKHSWNRNLAFAHTLHKCGNFYAFISTN